MRARYVALLALLVLLAAQLVSAAPAPLFYAVIADTQKPDDDPYEDFTWGVGQVNEIMPDFVLIPGDLTDTGTHNQYTNFMSVASQLKPPVYYAPGNHDGPPGQDLYRPRFSHYTDQQPYYHKQIGGWHLIVLDSVRFEDGNLQHDGEIDPEQIAWLREELQTIGPEEPILLSCHHPLIFRSQLVNFGELLGLFDGHHLVYTVTAHLHSNQYHQDGNAIHHFATGALSFTDGYCGIGYRWISTVGNELWTAWIETTEGPPLRLIHRLEGPGELAEPWEAPLPAAPQGPACVRVRYRGEDLTLHIGSGILGVSLSLPSAEEYATAFVPLSESTCDLVFSRPTPAISASTVAGATVEGICLYETTAWWEHYRLKKPGETRTQVSPTATECGG